MTRVSTVWVGALVLNFATACGAPDSSNDPTSDVTKSAAPMRVVTLAPHLAELMFDISAGDMLVGVSAYTDFPEAATEIPIVSDAFVVDHEKLTLLEPDLLLAWESGTPAHVVE